MSCPRCNGDLWEDVLMLAHSVCLLCGRRYNADLSPFSRAPTMRDEVESRLADRVHAIWLRSKFIRVRLAG